MVPSVLLAVMGPYPLDYEGGNTRADLEALVRATRTAHVELYVLPDLVKTVGPAKANQVNAEGIPWGPKHRGIHAMRCLAVTIAREGRWDYLFVVENDVKLAPDTLDRLLARGKDHIVPRHEFPDFPIIRAMVYNPVPPMGARGLHRIEWCGYPATLYRMAAFAGVEPMFVGGGEGFDYERWHAAGIETWMDLDVEAVNLRLATPHQIMVYVPGRVQNHLRVDGTGKQVLCDGVLYEYRSAEKGVDIFHLGCRGCDWHVDFRPPAGFRGEALRVSRILEQPVEATAR